MLAVARPAVHPSFCSPENCDPAPLDARHSSAPVPVRTHEHGPVLGVHVTVVDDDRLDGTSGQHWVASVSVPFDHDLYVHAGRIWLELDGTGRTELRRALDEVERQLAAAQEEAT